MRLNNMQHKTALFETNRRTLEGIAYRMLGSLAEAQDIVQDVFIKWHAAKDIENPRAWLITVCTRLTLNQLKSAKKQRELYYGVWLPEPYEVSADTHDRLELDESISVALLLLLEILTPDERAIYLLYDVFDYSFEDIARIIGKRSENCRKILSRARKKITDRKTRFEVKADTHRELVDAFIQAAQAGSIEKLESVIHNDAALYADGGGKVQAALNPVYGGKNIAEFLIKIWQDDLANDVNIEYKKIWFNGAPGLLVLEDGAIATAITFDVLGDQIRNLYAVRNPQKLSLFSHNDAIAMRT